MQRESRLLCFTGFTSCMTSPSSTRWPPSTPFLPHLQYLLSSAVPYSAEKVTASTSPLAVLKRADSGVLLIKNTCVISELQIALRQQFFFYIGLDGFPLSKHGTITAVMRYQFTCKAILLICLCCVGPSGLGLHCKAIEGSYCGDPVSQFDKRAEWRLWHRPEPFWLPLTFLRPRPGESSRSPHL